MEDFLASLESFVQQHRFWAAPLLGLITFGESMVFIGAFFPATVLMATAGGLVGIGMLNPWPVLAWCIAGATLGDAVSYWLGRKVGPGAWRRPWLTPHRKTLARARLFFRKYGFASIFLCRYMGPVRAFVPLIAGMTAMKQRDFQLANFLSACVWVPSMLAVGYLPAKGLASVDPHHVHTAGIVAAAAVAVTVAIAVGWRVLRDRLDREAKG